MSSLCLLPQITTVTFIMIRHKNVLNASVTTIGMNRNQPAHYLILSVEHSNTKEENAKPVTKNIPFKKEYAKKKEMFDQSHTSLIVFILYIICIEIITSCNLWKKRYNFPQFMTDWLVVNNYISIFHKRGNNEHIFLSQLHSWYHSSYFP